MPRVEPSSVHGGITVETELVIERIHLHSVEIRLANGELCELRHQQTLTLSIPVLPLHPASHADLRLLADG